MNTFDLTPEQASRGRVIPDGDLPMLAAHWLVDGHDSPLLRELAALTRRDATEARRLFGAVLAELGHPVAAIDQPYDELPWRGHWEQIRWASTSWTEPTPRTPRRNASPTSPTCGLPAAATNSRLCCSSGITDQITATT